MDPVLKSKTVWKPGSPMAIESISPSGPFAVVFEDDGQTGYLYAVDRSADETRPDSVQVLAQVLGNRTYHIVDVFHIYDATIPTKPIMAEVKWSRDGKKAGLWLGKELQAAVDFQARRGVCRTGLPPPSQEAGHWTKPHDWDETCTEHFA